jgi:hypothetical protein
MAYTIDKETEGEKGWVTSPDLTTITKHLN